MLIPYNDPFYYSRRPSLAVPAGNVLQIGTDSSRVALGLHPRLTGLQEIFDRGRLAFIQRTGYENQTRSHFPGPTSGPPADPQNPQGLGWAGRYLDSLPSPVDPLVGWNTTGGSPHVLQAAHVRSRPSQSPRRTRSRARTRGAEAAAERAAALRIKSHVPIDRPELAFVYGSSRRPWRRSTASPSVAAYAPSVAYPTTRAGSGPSGRRRGDGQRDRDAGVLRHNRRLRHAFRAERERGQRRVLRADGDAQRRAAGVLQRSEESGSVRGHAAGHVFRVRSPNQREQRGATAAPTTAPPA